MPIIRQLSETTINRIAAGEVVERPASVVKELIENALDAGATRIDITLEQAGKNLIIVSDNGCGISKDDLSVAIQRHTTSKLNEDDIMNISSFGFRGEALPSIGSVSRMHITSKRLDAESGFVIAVEGGLVADVRAAAHGGGTEVSIRDLFFATPARLKFLRSDRSEYTACLDIVKKIAMAHPYCAFSLTHNEKLALKLRVIEDNTTSLRGEQSSTWQSQQNTGEIATSPLMAPRNDEHYGIARISEILGEDFIRNCAKVDAQREDISISGFVSLPTYNRATSEDQYLFINNRPVKDKLIASALKVAYLDFLARDRFPVAAIFITTDPHFVDVNVHPAKTEVRFRESQLMRGLLISSIKEALGRESHKVSDTTGEAMLGAFQSGASLRGGQSPSWQSQQNNNEIATSPMAPRNDANGFMRPSMMMHDNSRNDYRREPQYYNPLIHTAPHSKTEEPVEDISIQNFPLGSAHTQLHETYIISQTADSIIITDQHAAHERLTYEKIKAQMASHEIPTQRILIPEIVELPDEKRADALRGKKHDLAKMGLVFEIFGEKSVIVNEIPQVIVDVNIAQLIHDIADNLIELGEDNALTSIIEHVTETYACHHSIRAGRKLSVHEMNHLLRQMEATPFSGQCNHGRPTYIELKLKDVERLFGR